MFRVEARIVDDKPFWFPLLATADATAAATYLRICTDNERFIRDRRNGAEQNGRFPREYRIVYVPKE